MRKGFVFIVLGFFLISFIVAQGSYDFKNPETWSNLDIYNQLPDNFNWNSIGKEGLTSWFNAQGIENVLISDFSNIKFELGSKVLLFRSPSGGIQERVVLESDALKEAVFTINLKSVSVKIDKNAVIPLKQNEIENLVIDPGQSTLDFGSGVKISGGKIKIVPGDSEGEYNYNIPDGEKTKIGKGESGFNVESIVGSFDDEDFLSVGFDDGNVDVNIKSEDEKVNGLDISRTGTNVKVEDPFQVGDPNVHIDLKVLEKGPVTGLPTSGSGAKLLSFEVGEKDPFDMSDKDPNAFIELKLLKDTEAVIAFGKDDFVGPPSPEEQAKILSLRAGKSVVEDITSRLEEGSESLISKLGNLNSAIKIEAKGLLSKGAEKLNGLAEVEIVDENGLSDSELELAFGSGDFEDDLVQNFKISVKNDKLKIVDSDSGVVGKIGNLEIPDSPQGITSNNGKIEVQDWINTIDKISREAIKLFFIILLLSIIIRETLAFN